jgi:hypothetical protein
MTKNVVKDNAGFAASKHSTRAAPCDESTRAAGGRKQVAGAREPHRRGVEQPREPLHARIVHFDAERSSGPPASSDED